MTLENYLNKHPKKFLVFDLDMTLVKLAWPSDIRVSSLVYEYFISLDKNLTAICKRKGYSGFNMMIKKYGSKVKKKIDDIYLFWETKMLKQAVYNQKLFDFIRRNKKYHYYIWSNNQKSTVEAILKDNNALGQFSGHITGTDVAFFKPEPEGFNKIFPIKNFNREEILMIGDSKNDEESAKNCGIDFFKIDQFKKPDKNSFK
jgi:HAD superfamily hydrolase (TIGR01549 family)